MLNRSCAVGAGALILIAACSDRAVTPPSETPVAIAANATRPEALAQMFAKGLKNAAFRAYLKAQLDASPYREHKLQFETFLAANGSRALGEIAAENGTSKDALTRQANAAIALEVYFPVPSHRAAWTGDEHVLVATAVTDDDPPIACQSKRISRGRRRKSSRVSWTAGDRSAASSLPLRHRCRACT